MRRKSNEEIDSLVPPSAPTSTSTSAGEPGTLSVSSSSSSSTPTTTTTTTTTITAAATATSASSSPSPSKSAPPRTSSRSTAASTSSPASASPSAPASVPAPGPAKNSGGGWGWSLLSSLGETVTAATQTIGHSISETVSDATSALLGDESDDETHAGGLPAHEIFDTPTTAAMKQRAKRQQERKQTQTTPQKGPAKATTTTTTTTASPKPTAVSSFPATAPSPSPSPISASPSPEPSPVDELTSLFSSIVSRAATSIHTVATTAAELTDRVDQAATLAVESAAQRATHTLSTITQKMETVSTAALHLVEEQWFDTPTATPTEPESATERYKRYSQEKKQKEQEAKAKAANKTETVAPVMVPAATAPASALVESDAMATAVKSTPAPTTATTSVPAVSAPPAAIVVSSTLAPTPAPTTASIPKSTSIPTAITTQLKPSTSSSSLPSTSLPVTRSQSDDSDSEYVLIDENGSRSTTPLRVRSSSTSISTSSSAASLLSQVGVLSETEGDEEMTFEDQFQAYSGLVSLSLIQSLSSACLVSNQFQLARFTMSERDRFDNIFASIKEQLTRLSKEEDDDDVEHVMNEIKDVEAATTVLEQYVTTAQQQITSIGNDFMNKLSSSRSLSSIEICDLAERSMSRIQQQHIRRTALLACALVQKLFHMAQTTIDALHTSTTSSSPHAILSETWITTSTSTCYQLHMLYQQLKKHVHRINHENIQAMEQIMEEAIKQSGSSRVRHHIDALTARGSLLTSSFGTTSDAAKQVLAGCMSRLIPVYQAVAIGPQTNLHILPDVTASSPT